MHLGITRVTITDTSEVIVLKDYFEKLKTHIAENPPDFGDAHSVLTLLYESDSEINNLDDAQSKADFRALDESMHVMTMQGMDPMLDPVFRLGRDHEC